MTAITVLLEAITEEICLKQQNSLGFYGTFSFQSAKLLWQCFPLIPNTVLSYIFLDFENIQMYQAIISTNVKLNGPKQVLLRSDNKVLEKNNNFQMKSLLQVCLK